MGPLIAEFGKIYGSPILVVLLGAWAYVRFSNTILGLSADVMKLHEKVDQNNKDTASCRAKREEVEDELHGRVTENAKKISEQKGRLNGQQEARV